MTRQATIVDIFLSSPSDVDDEREFIELAAREWNVLRSYDTGYFLNVLTWRDTVAPGLGDRPQDVVNTGIGDTYDVYLGMMWGRFGTDTGAAESGTVEEFELALSRYRRGEEIRLVMLFKTNDVPQKDLIGSQYDKVQEFKKRFSEEGGYYGEFDSDDRLRITMNKVFEDIVRSRREKGFSSSQGGDRTCEDNTTSASGRHGKGDVSKVAQDEDSDYGLLDVNEDLDKVSKLQVEFLDGLTTVSKSTTDDISAASEKMQSLAALGKVESAKIKPIIGEISRAMDKSSQFLETGVPEFKINNDQLVLCTERAIDLTKDFPDDREGRDNFRYAIVGLTETLRENRDALLGTIESEKSIPRMTTDFNRSRKRLIAQQSSLLEEISRLIDFFERSIKLFE